MGADTLAILAVITSCLSLNVISAALFSTVYCCTSKAGCARTTAALICALISTSYLARWSTQMHFESLGRCGGNVCGYGTFGWSAALISVVLWLMYLIYGAIACAFAEDGEGSRREGAKSKTAFKYWDRAATAENNDVGVV